MSSLALGFVLGLLVVGQSESQTPAPATSLAGTVLDASGAPIGGAAVTVFPAGLPAVRTVTAPDGTFSVRVPAGPVTITAVAPGFAERLVELAAPASGPIDLELTPRGLAETVVVSADSGPVRLISPAAATVLDREALRASPSLGIDDQLRSVPGFSLFRRSSARVANPTTQGVTLRGLAGSGASRTLVLADDVPLNDPFGGWVYWDRLPAAALQRVEVARGAASDLHGSDALGGAIRIESASGEGARAVVDGGTDATFRASAFGGRRFGRVTAFGAAESFTTDGYVIVAPESRGPIDRPARSKHSTGYAGLGVGGAGSARLELRGSYFSEDRNNGTPFQTNATTIRQFTGSAGGSAAGGAWTTRGYAAWQDYDQTFSAIAADRMSERPASRQHVDSTSGAAWAEWLRAWRSWAVLTGVSFREVRADLTEQSLFSAGAPAVTTLARQRTGALVVQTTFTPSTSLMAAGGIRGEVWRSALRDGSESQTLGFFVPRASIVWKASPLLALRGAVQAGYRAPTINELYRPFRVGNVLTMANAGLGPEESVGFEASALLTGGAAAGRITGFWTRLDDAILNVTLSSAPSGIVRQRQNAGRIRAAGIEVEGELRLRRHVVVTAATAYTHSVFAEGGELEGLRVPQVPRWQASAGARGVWPAASASVEWRFIGTQFDDDLNELPLDASSMVNVRAGWRPTRRVELFAAVENAFDEIQDVGRTPLRTIGLPRTARAGLVFDW